MKYKIKYFFDGNGEVFVNAKSFEEAKEKFFDGEFKKEKEWGDSYNIDQVWDNKGQQVSGYNIK